MLELGSLGYGLKWNQRCEALTKDVCVKPSGRTLAAGSVSHATFGNPRKEVGRCGEAYEVVGEGGGLWRIGDRARWDVVSR